ncbi:MAG TPA: DUF1080 domain-containing protein [Puia sp.]|nr:DUF1080 domain-containing protein [Puia sp.]
MKRFPLTIVLLAITTALFAQKEGWTPLFDGKTLNGWKRLAGTADYSVENGAIVGTSVVGSGNSFLVTDKEFGDFVLEMDVKIDDTTGNSGIQLRSHYDPAGHNGNGLVFGYQYEVDPSSRRWTGGIYDEGRRGWLYPVALNHSVQSAFKAGQWNHIRVECIGSSIRTWVDGLATAYVIDTMDSKGFIGLQVHAAGNPDQAGKKVYFKNIRIRTTDFKPGFFPPGIYVVNNIPNALTDYEKKSGWRLLFDGNTSKGWIGAYQKTFPSHGWKIDTGVLTVSAGTGEMSTNGGDIVTTGMYKSFDLSFEFRLTPGANSGVKYFVTLKEEHSANAGIGLEYQLLDDSLHPDAKLGRNGDRTLSSLYDLIPANKQRRFLRPIGEWNTGRIIVYPDNHVEHYLNGVKVLEYERGSAAFRALVAISKYKIYPNFGEAPAGHILLQDHGNEVGFRSIKIREL